MSSINKNGDWKCGVCRKIFKFGTPSNILTEPRQGESFCCLNCGKSLMEKYNGNNKIEHHQEIELY